MGYSEVLTLQFIVHIHQVVVSWELVTYCINISLAPMNILNITLSLL